MNNQIFEPNFEEEYNNKIKKQLVAYICFIIIIVIAILIYSLTLLKRGLWTKEFELSEIKKIVSASIGNEIKDKKDTFNLNCTEDIYISFLNKKQNIKEIKLKNFKTNSKNNISIHKFSNENALFEEEGLKENEIICFKIPQNQEKIITSFRIKNLGVSDIKIKKNYVGKPNLKLLKEFQNKDKEKLDYEIEFDIEIKLKNGESLITHLKIENDKNLDFSKEMDIKYLDINNIRFHYNKK